MFTDPDGLPITYKLFTRNTLDKQTLLLMLCEVRKPYRLRCYIVVADRGMMCGDNIRLILLEKCGYVPSYSIRGSDAAFKEYVPDKKV